MSIDTTMSDFQRDSDVIKFIRFPLIAWVVFAHSVLCSKGVLMENGYTLCSYVVDFLTIGIRTPIFFFISGYLFFLGVEKFEIHTYLGKLKRRVHTLLIPYLIWNAIVIGYFAIAHSFLPGLINPDMENVSGYSILDFVRAFWDKSGGQPIAYQLWFLRDLILISLLSPLVYIFCKYCKLKIGLLLLIILYCIDYNFRLKPVLVFFSMGACFAINKASFTMIFREMEKFGRLVLIFVGGGIILSSLLFPNIELLRKICTLVYMALFVLLIIFLVNKGCRMPKLLSDSNYFVYLWHGFPILAAKLLYDMLFHPSTGPQYLCGTFIVWIVTVSLAVLLYALLNKYLPKTTSVLIGRKRK